jgi:hypothetical protein
VAETADQAQAPAPMIPITQSVTAASPVFSPAGSAG